MTEAGKGGKVYTVDEVAKHNTPQDAWVIIDGKIYDVTKFAPMHPGGTQILLDYAGKDCSQVFWDLHRAEVLVRYAPRMYVGRVKGAPSQAPIDLVVPGAISEVPYAESTYWQKWKSPYYDESHERLRKYVREIYDKEIIPKAVSFENMGKEPTPDMYKLLGQAGILIGRIGPGPAVQYAPKLPADIPREKFSYFHELVVHEENSRMGTPGFSDGIGAGLVIGLPPVVYFGKPQIKERVCREVLAGEKTICLAITEPFAGSDVANIQCTAKLTPDGKHYIVNGIKKWITNGTFADYFTTAVRTGGKGIGGISLLLIERGPGVTTKKIVTSYSPAAGTALVILENVKVPVENLLGEENRGFQVIMGNFNHERWMICIGVIRATRLIIEECFKWAHQRRVFGKRLIDQPVIRQQLASMVSQLEGCQSWLELITYQMDNMSYKEQNRRLAGPIALLKYQSTRVALSVSDQACQIFGGRAITRSGMGQVIERFQRSIKYGAILGGSEEIMADLGIRQAMKYYPPMARL